MAENIIDIVPKLVHYNVMVKIPKIISAFFFQNDHGKEPVKDWILSLSPNDKKIIGEDIKTVELGWPVGMPHVRPVGDRLFEARSNLSDKRISRILFVIYKDQMVLLHGFIKKDPTALPWFGP